jgi:cysteine desulfurase
MIYLDYNATAPIRPQVIARMSEVMAAPCNPSSVHKQGRAARALVERSRKNLAEMLSCFPAELIFTGSGTEATVTALRAFEDRPMAVSATEHASVLKSAPHAVRLPVDSSGLLDMAALDAFLKDAHAPVCVSVMLANNETGVIQPMRAIADAVHAYGGVLHCDAVQAFGKIPVDITLLGADMVSLSAHKMGGSQGVGALIVNQHLAFPSLITGGGQELGRRSGTENVAGIVGFALAAELALSDTAWQRNVRAWLDVLEAHCAEIAGTDAIILGKHAPRLPNTSCIRLPALSSETQLMRFDLAGIAVSAGSACSSGRIEPSHVVRAMLGEEAGNDIVRVSAGWDTLEADIAAFGEVWAGLAGKRG